MPVAAVSRLQTAVPIAISLVLCHLSLKWPKGSPTSAYIQMNTVPKNPSAVSLNRNSLRIGSPNDPSNWRSKKFSKLMANSTNSANFAPVAALLSEIPAPWPAGGTPSSVSGLTDIDESPQEGRPYRQRSLPHIDGGGSGFNRAARPAAAFAPRSCGFRRADRFP